jgi:uncharacterized Fe-S cluster-containing radical SAM superfamily protein
MKIDTVSFSAKLRAKSINVQTRKLLVTNYIGSEQEKDLSEPANCNGFGRIRHFHRRTTAGWPENPLPIDPAAMKLDLPPQNVLVAQVFQSASCNWRCWYCYVPFDLLGANENRAAWLTCGELLDLYQTEPSPSRVIDLSGGQPDLTPEWVSWMMKELRNRNLAESIYLWSDDNLSNDYFWRYLSEDDISLISQYRNYGKVCCFKGFNASSFAFNTAAEPDLFAQQLALFRRYVEIGIDLYAYATFTTPDASNIQNDMRRFVDDLQSISANLPLRVIPLEIQNFSPMKNRVRAEQQRAMQNQWSAIECWKSELERRFKTSEREQRISDVRL